MDDTTQNLRAAVLRELSAATEPMSSAEIADQIVGATTDAVSRCIGWLKSNRYIERYHSPTGTLRYSLSNEGRAYVKSRETSSATDLVRSIISRADHPLTMGEITDQASAAGVSRAKAKGATYGLVQQRWAERRAGAHGATVFVQRASEHSTDSRFPPAPSSAPESTPTGPAPVASESPASPPPPVDAAPPFAAPAAAPETFNGSIADGVKQLARDLELATREMADDGTDGESLRQMIGCVALANRLAGMLTAGAALLLMLAVGVLGDARAAAAPGTAARADVLVIEHTPTGAVERTGYLGAWRYDGSAMLVEFTDDGDALFHNGFDGPPTP